MNPAINLVRIVEKNGGRLRVDGDTLVIFPERAAMPIIDKLKEYKHEIMAFISNRETEGEAWVGLWMDDRCIFRDGCSGAVGGLYLDFARWCAARSLAFEGGRGTFQAALLREGCRISKGFVYGLLPREDFEPYRPEWPPAPTAHATRRKPKINFLSGKHEAA